MPVPLPDVSFIVAENYVEFTTFLGFIRTCFKPVNPPAADALGRRVGRGLGESSNGYYRDYCRANELATP
jgi:hypothetical protein